MDRDVTRAQRREREREKDMGRLVVWWLIEEQSISSINHHDEEKNKKIWETDSRDNSILQKIGWIPLQEMMMMTSRYYMG